MASTRIFILMNSTLMPVFLDYHSTTPVDPAVLEAMMPFFNEHFGNPASRSHPYGWKASEAVELARKHVAQLINARPEEIIFTSGATEALNLAIKGLAEKLSHKGRHIIASSTEHNAVLDPLKWLAKKNYEVTLLPVDKNGLLDPGQLEQACRPDTILCLTMWANNETGVIQDLDSIGEICNKKGIAFVCDATQAAGKIEMDAPAKKIDLLALSAHKMYGPKGTGALYVAKNEKKLKPEAIIHGGGHEQGLRSGTLNVTGIVGFGAAALRAKDCSDDMVRIAELRDKFESEILTQVELSSVNGAAGTRLPTVTNILVKHVDSQAVMTRLRTKLAISSGSACSSSDPSPSHVLLAMGLTHEEAKGSFRISLGRPTTEEEMTNAARWLIAAIEEHRAQSPVWQMYKSGMKLA